MTSHSLTPALRVVSSRVAEPHNILEWTQPEAPLVWSFGHNVMVGFGQAVRMTFSGPHRAAELRAAWDRLCQTASIENTLGETESVVRGTGLVAFVARAFSESSAVSDVLIVPSTVLGIRDGVAFESRVTLGDAHQPAVPTALGPAPVVSWQAPADAEVFQSRVSAALERIRAGVLHKVVLARAVDHALESGDVRQVVDALRDQQPLSWVFAVDGMVGASPETLVDVQDGSAIIRVLAGTRAASAGADAELLTSTKDNVEHRAAVDNVLASLRVAGIDPVGATEPFALSLPDMWHLATDVRISGVKSPLDVIDSITPTAAVAGVPTDRAVATISALETFDRGRYSGPVGWMDHNGNGEWAIALRCAEFGPETVRVFAGAGIVDGSDPAMEFAETELKMRTIRSAVNAASR